MNSDQMKYYAVWVACGALMLAGVVGISALAYTVRQRRGTEPAVITTAQNGGVLPARPSGSPQAASTKKHTPNQAQINANSAPEPPRPAPKIQEPPPRQPVDPPQPAPPPPWAPRKHAGGDGIPDLAAKTYWELLQLASSPYLDTRTAIQPVAEVGLLPQARDGMGLNRPSRVKTVGVLQQQLARWDNLVSTKHLLLGDAPQLLHDLFTDRVKFSTYNDLTGNTPNNSVQQFGEFCQRFRAERRDLLEALWNAAEFKKFQGQIEASAARTGVLTYANMHPVRGAGEVWRTRLLPLGIRDSGGARPEPLVKVTPWWDDADRPGGNTKRIYNFPCRNVSDRELTRVIMEVKTSSSWGDDVTQYYYLSSFPRQASITLLLHPAWSHRLCYFVNSITMTVSVWSDQASSHASTFRFDNPAGNPAAAGWREIQLPIDREWGEKGRMVWGAVRPLQTKSFLDAIPR